MKMKFHRILFVSSQKNGVLMRKWRPPDVPADDEWAVKCQIVVPKVYRPEILSMAHETPLARHMYVNKTQQRILSHFYWPNLRRDVADFCRSCHACQVVGSQIKPYQRHHYNQSQQSRSPSAILLLIALVRYRRRNLVANTC